MTPMLAVLDMLLNLISSDIGSSVGALLGTDSSTFSVGVDATKCTPETCPGSFYTAIATAWANIGYLTHADVLRFLNTTHFGKWAILLYIAAAITGLLGVATNSPMRNYTWFFIGPALYSFLVGTTTPVTGVNWVVANVAVKDMSEVWKNAETGLANTRLAIDQKVTINGKDGPTTKYDVAMPMVFLDELFSATSNILIEWTGIGRSVAGKGNNTNLANPSSNPEGPWWLMSTLKWSFVENIVSANVRNPDVRDALITFLGSECGEKFKEGINSGAYIAAAQVRGVTPVTSVMIEDGAKDYEKFIENLSNVAIPAPRSLARLFREGKSLQYGPNMGGGFVGPPLPGLYDPSQPNYVAPNFLNFSKTLLNAIPAGRGHGIVCSEYLWTIIQALRYEAGQAYYQLTRSSPTGLDEKQFVSTLIYGWDVRKKPDSPIAQADEQEAFVKHLILTYIVRNELLYAPQITSVDQRFSPSAQAKSYSDAYVKTYGSKAKFIELYNAAIMMPYLQGILAYILIVAYPLACMLVILPGHYKGFFTWVSFFAWIKLWDVGFAMVQVIERSVWAMIGNHGHMASTANVLINTAEKVGGIGVTNPVGAGMGNGFGVLNPSALAAQAAVPIVCSIKSLNGECNGSMAGEDQTLPQAVELFDKLLLTGANIDLDLSNGWYIYIMSALYLAVPAVTGQLVLGAKAGSAGLIKDAFSGVGNDGSNAAKTGAQHKDVNALTTNKGSLGQAAYAKALRKGTGADGQGPSLAAQSFKAGVDGSELGVTNSALGGEKDFLQAKAGMAEKGMQSLRRGTALGKAAVSGLDSNGLQKLFPNKTKDGDGSAAGAARGWIGSGAEVAAAAGEVGYGHKMDGMSLDSASKGQDIGWNMKANELNQGRLRDAAGKYGSAAEFEAQSAAWEAKNEFASHASAMGGIAGINAGNLSPGEKPMQMEQLAVSGMLDGWGSQAGKKTQSAQNNASGSAWYSADEGGLKQSIGNAIGKGQTEFGGAGIRKSWEQGGGDYTSTGSFIQGAKEGVNPNNYINQKEIAAPVSAASSVVKGAKELGDSASSAVKSWADNMDGMPNNK